MALSKIGSSCVAAAISGLVAAASIGCDASRESESRSSSATMGDHATATVQRAIVQHTTLYPRGRWRLANPEDLDRVVLWVSQVLVRHQGVRGNIISFAAPAWYAAPPPPSRSREEAFGIAERIAERAANGANFADLARQYSEDVATQERGGSLGGITATQLSLSPDVLDALAALRPGETSRVVETVYGFHILYLRPAPALAENVSGARIVIGYDDAPWLNAFGARRPIPSRSRTDAFALASSIYERAQKGEDFDELVQLYSEHHDATRDGDFGSWSTTEPTVFPREVEVLGELRPGEVAPPLDSIWGVQVIKRMPERARASYSMAALKRIFDVGGALSVGRTRVAAETEVRALGSQTASSPDRFDQLGRDGCCVEMQQWVEGRGWAPAERVLRTLQPGAVASEPVELPGSYALLKRLVPHPTPPAAVTFQLPAPAAPDVSYLASEHGVKRHARAIGLRGREVLGLTGDVGAKFQAIHEAAALGDELELNEQRAAHFEAMKQAACAVLGAALCESYGTFLERYFEDYLLTPSTSQRGSG